MRNAVRIGRVHRPLARRQRSGCEFVQGSKEDHMKVVRRLLTVALSFAVCSGVALAETPAERVHRNVQLLRSGAVHWNDLSPAERQELAAAERIARHGSLRDRRTPRQRCIDEEVKREGKEPSELTMGIIDLRCSQR